VAFEEDLQHIFDEVLHVVSPESVQAHGAL